MRKMVALIAGTFLSGLFSVLHSQECSRPFVEPFLQAKLMVSKDRPNIDLLGGISLNKPANINVLAGIKQVGYRMQSEDKLEGREVFMEKQRTLFVGSFAYKWWIGEAEHFSPYVTVGHRYVELGLSFCVSWRRTRLGFVVNTNSYCPVTGGFLVAHSFARL